MHLFLESVDSPSRIAIFELINLLNLLSSADYFWNQHFRNTIWVSNSLNPEQTQHFVRPDLGPYCLQRLSADDIGKHSINSDC